MDQVTLLRKISEDEAQRTAFYNTIFFMLLGVVVLCLYCLYQMFSMFITPLIMGTLFATVLFPLKRSCSSNLNDYLNQLDHEEKPLIFGLLLIPIKSLNKTARFVFDSFYRKQGLWCVGGYIFLKILAYNGTLIAVLSILGRIYLTFDSVLDFLTQAWIIPLITLFAIAYFSWLFIQDAEELHRKKKFARTLSLPIWIIVLAFASSYCGFLQLFVFTASAVLLILIALGLIGNIKSDENGNDSEGKSTVDREEISPETNHGEQSSETMTALPEVKNLEQAITGDRILQTSAALFALLWTTRHDLVLIVVLILLFYGFILDFAKKLQLWDKLITFVQETLSVKQHGAKIANIVVPGLLRRFFYVLFTSDRYLVGGLKQKVDLIASVSVMIFLAFGSLVFFGFTAYQVHSETIHIGNLAANVISSNPDWLNTAMNYTGDSFNEQTINTYAEQAYKQTREWLGYNIRSLADPRDKGRADQLEEQAKILVDNLYHLYEERMTNLPSNATAIANRSDWLTQILSTTNINSLKSEITMIIKENIETILSIAQSLWKVLAVNISLISTVAFSIITLLLGFGFDLLNFVIEIVVFLMVAYYLLANSGEQFLPLKLISDIAPSIQRKDTNIQVASAIEDAVTSVYVLTAKMSIYYFLHNYFVHAVFDLNVVFIPSLLAAILAPVPVAPPYVVAIFGVVELYLVRGETLAAIVFMCGIISPIFFADAAFYSEIKHCHPYLIGLSIVGGIYSMGVQGTVIGPIVLCCLIVLCNVYAEFAKQRDFSDSHILNNKYTDFVDMDEMIGQIKSVKKYLKMIAQHVLNEGGIERSN